MKPFAVKSQAVPPLRPRRRVLGRDSRLAANSQLVLLCEPQ